jgi:hypothetical protein
LIASFSITVSPLFAEEKPEVFVQLGHSSNTKWTGISDREGKVVQDVQRWFKIVQYLRSSSNVSS